MVLSRYPSSTSSLEPAPISSTRSLGSEDATFSFHASRNYTASDFICRRPPFSESQSVPNLPLGKDASPSRLSPARQRQIKNRRRVSEPIQSSRRISRAGCATQNPKVSRRVSSAQTMTLPENAYAAPSTVDLHSPESSTSCVSTTSPAVKPSTTSSPSPSTPRASLTPSTPRSKPASPLSEDTPLFKPSPEFLTTPKAVNRTICCKLQEKLTPQDGDGIIYIIRDPAQPQRGYKIGVTERYNYLIRISEIWQDCKFTPEIVDQFEVPYRKRTELLIHLDLVDRKRILECEGHKNKKVSPEPTQHKEWFDITEDEAKQTVMKWVSFMKDEKPYSAWRCLSPMWTQLINERCIAQPLTRTVMNHNTRRAQWRHVLSSPTPWDRLRLVLSLLQGWRTALINEFVFLWPYCVEYFWRAIALLYGFILIIILPNRLTAMTFVFVSLCACVSIRTESKRCKKGQRAKKSGESCWS